MNTIQQLQSWFARHCDGDREHQYGITIETLDNPGWSVKIDLTGTQLANQTFLPIRENVGTSGFQDGVIWFWCRVEDSVWQGAGDETKLEQILDTFLSWAKGTESEDKSVGKQ